MSKTSTYVDPTFRGKNTSSFFAYSIKDTSDLSKRVILLFSTYKNTLEMKRLFVSLRF